MALELLLLPGGAAAAGVAVVVLPVARRPVARPRGVLPRLPADVRERRLREHVDIPFWNDREVGSWSTSSRIHASIEEFRAELWSASFDSRRLDLH